MELRRCEPLLRRGRRMPLETGKIRVLIIHLFNFSILEEIADVESMCCRYEINTIVLQRNLNKSLRIFNRASVFLARLDE